MFSSVPRALLISLLLPCVGRVAEAVNPASWTIVEQLNRSDSTKTWVSPTPVDLGKMVWSYDYQITEVTGTVSVPIIGSITQDITSSIPDDDRMGSGETRNLPAVLLDEILAEPTTGTSADVLVEVDNLGFGRAVFSNIMLGSVDVPLFGNRPIQRINIEASVMITGFDFGDYNRDGRVDAADYVVWRDQLGQTGPGLHADANGDERVDAVDFATWRAYFGRSGGPIGTGSSVVPEPSTWLVLAMGILGTIDRRIRAGGRVGLGLAAADANFR